MNKPTINIYLQEYYIITILRFTIVKKLNYDS